MTDFREFGPPRRVEGGLQAKSRRGDIARSWWSRRFIEVLESFGMGGRLQRGKRYARAGQVLSLSLSTSLVVGQVQGSRETPYRVRIAVSAFPEADWRRVEQALAARALYAAKLLAGQMPEDVEEVFTAVGLTLFPTSMRELTMDCTCPDWEIPCKHLAAACYLLAESFDEDPFEIFAWRGRTRTDLLDRLRALRDRAEPGGTRADRQAPPLADVLDSFWTAPHPAPAVPPTPQDGPPDALLDQLDPLPVTLRGQPVVDLLRPAYQALAEPDD
ncbi:MAG TPA: SWIM zinc finger family protein [Pseudonocardiaceae bacterium]|nr:SWIM zinc finger family protein [Pseudonocardiaceae bacterium]